MRDLVGWVREACQSRFPRERGFSCRVRDLVSEERGVRIEIDGDHLRGVILVVPAQGRGGYREAAGERARARIIAEALVPEIEDVPNTRAIAPVKREALAARHLDNAGVLFTAVMIELAVCVSIWFFLMVSVALLDLLPLETALEYAAKAALYTCLGLTVGAPLWERALSLRPGPAPPGLRSASAWEGVCRELEELSRTLHADRLPAIALVSGG